MESEIIILPVKARHFKDANFNDPGKCPIAKAAIDFFEIKSHLYVTEVFDRLNIYLNVNTREKARRRFIHKRYEENQFNTDLIKAEQADDDTIIFNLELNEVTDERNI